ncbi:HTH-type transcriptional regulator GalR [Pararobbsia alpina]|uniref:LysR family transcriptional regulator n=1 Tax=Pararobbsia alpina TaxID=621374 RepID=UPI0039A5453C
MKARKERDNGTLTLLSLAHLKVFLHVIETGSASLAAKQVFKAQSAVSRALNELEHMLGAPLFERTPSGMLPTASGRCVAERAQRVFNELQTLTRLLIPKAQAGPAQATLGVASCLLNTRRLEIFVGLARDRHMPTTARAFDVSQPAISIAIRALESGAGSPLFYRSGRGLSLTANGDTCALYVQRALNELRRIPEDLAALHGTVLGVVHVGALPLGRAFALPEAIARLSREHPGIMIVTDESAYELLCAKLRSGDIDFILGALREPAADSGLVVESLWIEDMVVLARRGHPLAAKASLKLSQTTGEQWILPRVHAPARRILERLFAAKGLDIPPAAVETADLAIIRGVLTRSNMLAALSAHQLGHEIESGDIVRLALHLPRTERKIGLTLRADSVPAPAVRLLLETIRAVVADMREDEAGRTIEPLDEEAQ